MISTQFYAIVAGVGPGTGRSVAIRFSKVYPVVLLARRPESYDNIVTEINQAGGRAIGIIADTADQASVASAFETIKQKFPDLKLAAAIYNVRPNGRPGLKSFLELSIEELDSSLNGNVRGLFHFAQKALPLLLESVESSPHPPTLVVTGATASLRGRARFADIAAGKNAQRALTQSIAREFGPRGIHAAHAIIDGGIDIPLLENIQINDGAPDGKISPNATADSYWYLHTQHRSAFTQELDLRPYVEKF